MRYLCDGLDLGLTIFTDNPETEVKRLLDALLECSAEMMDEVQSLALVSLLCEAYMYGILGEQMRYIHHVLSYLIRWTGHRLR